MFDFEKLSVYQKAKGFHKDVLLLLLENSEINPAAKNQLQRASLSIPLNIAEGTSRMTNPSKRNFYVIARGSAFECVAILEILMEQNTISKDVYAEFYQQLDELSRMLFKMIRQLS